MNLENKVIVITGGSQGFGKSLASLFSKEGCRVIISSHDKESLEKTAKGLSVDSFLSDVTRPEELSNLGEYAFSKYGKIDI